MNIYWLLQSSLPVLSANVAESYPCMEGSDIVLIGWTTPAAANPAVLSVSGKCYAVLPIVKRRFANPIVHVFKYPDNRWLRVLIRPVSRLPWVAINTYGQRIILFSIAPWISRRRSGDLYKWASSVILCPNALVPIRWLQNDYYEGL